MRENVPSSRRIGLVLGAGGTVGCAYHAGVISSLEHHLGWDARQATSIVGTSAGSLVGALLRCDVGPADLVALSRGTTLDEFGTDAFTHLRQATARRTPGLVDLARGVRAPSVLGLLRTLRHRSVRPALLSMMSGAREDLSESVADLDALIGSAWPTADLRICTVDANTGLRYVVDRASGISLGTAVAASCAVPGVFAAQRANGRRLVDGGVHSATNLDALELDALDEVWVIAPMAGRTFHQLPTRHIQRFIAAQLGRELRSVPKGMPVRMFVPGREASTAIGIDLMATDRADRTILAGFLETGDQVSSARDDPKPVAPGLLAS
ncbi:MAG: Patatin [Ilumatobacteraceae bacterium]|nr:Patatin [Ilumatobacteraceae bacterium]MCU1387276.1 Patatin [Ilumatobacteraceae bacterium]